MGDASETEQLMMAKSRISALERELDESKGELDYFDAEHKTAIERAETRSNTASLRHFISFFS